MVELIIKIDINGQKEILEYDEAKELYEELKKIFDKKEPGPVMYYPPTVKDRAGDVMLFSKQNSLQSDKNVLDSNEEEKDTYKKIDEMIRESQSNLKKIKDNSKAIERSFCSK